MLTFTQFFTKFKKKVTFNDLEGAWNFFCEISTKQLSVKCTSAIDTKNKTKSVKKFKKSDFTSPFFGYKYVKQYTSSVFYYVNN